MKNQYTSFFISGPNINSLQDAANNTISSYSHEIITDKNTHNTTTQNPNINFINKVEQIVSKKKNKLLRSKLLKKTCYNSKRTAIAVRGTSINQKLQEQ